MPETFAEEFARKLRDRTDSKVPITEQHTTYLIRRELEKGDTSFGDLLRTLRAIRPEISREYLRQMLDLGVDQGVIVHLGDNAWRWRGVDHFRPLDEQIDQLGAEDTARLRAWLAGARGSLRLSPWLVIEAAGGGRLMIRTRRREAAS